MQEAFIHFVWKHQYFNKTDLKTTDGDSVNIVKPGFYNTDAGPDFKEGKIIIDALEWRGSVEIHHRSSDWEAHHHQKDRAYDNVVLHVVWQHDKSVTRSDGSEIPTLEIGGRVDTTLINNYRTLINSLSSVPCAHALVSIDQFVMASMVEKTTVERLHEKAKAVEGVYAKTGCDWEATAFAALAKNFGFKTNGDQFQRLAELVPPKLLSKHSNSLTQIEALLFGQAGFLEHTAQDEYQAELKGEHRFLEHKYGLPGSMSEFQWKFLRLRPANFPTLRLAQLAAVMQNTDGLFSRLKEVRSAADLQKLFGAETSAYWKEHYRFGKKAKTRTNGLGISSIENIGINTVAPLLVAYGRSVDQQSYIDQALELLQTIKPEDNRIMKVWKGLEITPSSAYESQGLIQLFNGYCLRKRCLSCAVGTKILQDH